MIRREARRRLGLAGILTVMILNSASLAAACPGGGEEATARLSLTPTSKTFTTLNRYEQFTMINTGSVRLSIERAYVSNENFERADPNACTIQVLSPGQECVIFVQALVAGRTGTFTVETDRGVRATSSLRS
jgi:hypothetical protein